MHVVEALEFFEFLNKEGVSIGFEDTDYVWADDWLNDGETPVETFSEITKESFKELVEKFNARNSNTATH